MGTPEIDLSLDQWAACACAALAQLQEEIDALDDAGRQAFVAALLRRLAPSTPLPD